MIFITLLFYSAIGYKIDCYYVDDDDGRIAVGG